MFSTLILSVEFRMLLLPRKVFSHRHLLSSTVPNLPKMFAKSPRNSVTSVSQRYLFPSASLPRFSSDENTNPGNQN